jgi:pimeloyl-ACP methyl ester carboxylesterase
MHQGTENDSRYSRDATRNIMRSVLFCLLAFLDVILLPSNTAAADDQDADHNDVPALVVPAVEKRFGTLFDSREFRYGDGGQESEQFKYRLFVPVISPGKKFPILVWLHGFGEAGNDNLNHMAWLGSRVMSPPWQRQRFPYFVLCVQCPANNPIWNDHMIRVNDAILEDVLSAYPIDPNRVYLCGISSGGTGCWEYALRRPDRFAAVAPLAASQIHGDLHSLKDVPVWTFHSTDDIESSVTGARRNAANLRAAGGNVKLTEIDSASHDCWTAAFHKHQLLDWMLAQRRGGPIVMDVRSWDQRLADLFAGWTVPQLIGQVVVIGLLSAGSFGFLKRLQTERRIRWPSGQEIE